MKDLLSGLLYLFDSSAPFLGLFFGTLVLSLFLTPLCRGLARRLGMVDVPSARRINTVPIPRGGGLAVYLSLVAALVCTREVFGFDIFAYTVCTPAVGYGVMGWAGLLVAVGFVDDRFGLPPLVKLAGQIVVACGTHFLCGIGFQQLFPALPGWIDAPLTVFCLLGAINAFNLIDGLDGLATGLALIAAVGMGGALFFTGRPYAALVYFAFAGACVGFLRYNFNPASVFLGDTGSMFLGYFLGTMPLLSGGSKSLLVSLGVPVLAMGVPLFDMSLAVFRRTVRALLFRESNEEAGNRHLMQADTDHLHHRLLRSFASQRKAAFALYALASFLVVIGLGGLALKGRAAALFLVGFCVVIVIAVRDMRRVELWDMGRLLDTVAHRDNPNVRKRHFLMSTPFFIVFDLFTLFAAWFLASLFLNLDITLKMFNHWALLRVVPIFLALVVCRTYRTVWSRALLVNYAFLALAVVLGTLATAVLVVVAQVPHSHMVQFSSLYGALVLLGLVAVRTLRPLVRDFFFALNGSRLKVDSATSRILVYGAGLRYRAFRRELVRAGSKEHRIVVGLLDDNILLRGNFIGRIRVEGSLEQAPEIIRRLQADTVVLACVMTPERRAEAIRILTAAHVRVVDWRFTEETLFEGGRS